MRRGVCALRSLLDHHTGGREELVAVQCTLMTHATPSAHQNRSARHCGSRRPTLGMAALYILERRRTQAE